MICVSFMLAILQLWPVVFGRGGDSGAAIAAAKPIPEAVARPTAVVKPLVLKAKPAGGQSMPTCYQTYERRFGQCGGGDSSCQLKVGDDWDVCEATGLWPE